MSDPHVSPEHETPMQRRERLMNLTNPSWVAPPSEGPEELAGEETTMPEAVVAEPTTEPLVKAKK